MKAGDRTWVAAAALLCLAVGFVAATGPVRSIGTLQLGPERWYAAAIGAVVAAGVGLLAWSRLRRLRACRHAGRLVVVAALAMLGATAAAATTTATSDRATTVDVSGEAGTDTGGASAPAVGAPADGLGQRWQDLGGVQGAVVLLAGLALLVAGIVFFGRQSELRAVPATPTFLRSDLDLADGGDEATDDELADALARVSLRWSVDDAEPRRAVIAAYEHLLDELADAGLPRRHYEAPLEYVTRCLAARPLPREPVTTLVDTFALARFSEHPIDAEHATVARRSLDEIAAALRSTAGVGAPS